MPTPIALVQVGAHTQFQAAPTPDTPRVTLAVDPAQRGERGIRLVQAPTTPGPSLAQPRTQRVASVSHTVSWQVGLPSPQATRAFFQALLDHRDAIDISGINLGSFSGRGSSPTRMLSIPLVTIDRHREVERAALMDQMHDVFGVPRYDDVRARALELPLNPCIVEPVDVDAVRAMLRSGVLDEDLIQTIYARRGPMPPYIDPAQPYSDGGNIEPDPEKNPACQVA